MLRFQITLSFFLSFFLFIKPQENILGCPRVVMITPIDCGNVVNEFELKLRITFTFGQIPFGKVMNPLILPTMD